MATNYELTQKIAALQQTNADLITVVGTTNTNANNAVTAAAATLAQSVKSADLSTASTVPIGGFNAAESQSILDNALPLANYAALRTYTGRAFGVRITGLGVAGLFQRDTSDTTSSDNGGTIIVDSANRRWKRIFDQVLFDHFGAIGNGTTDDTVAIQNAINFAMAQKLDVCGTPGKVYRITSEINVPKNYTGVQRGYRTIDGRGCGIFIDGNITGFSYTPAYNPPSSAPLLEKANYLVAFKNINFSGTQNSGAIGIRIGGFITSTFDSLNFIAVDYPFWQENSDPRGTPDYVQSAKISNLYTIQHKTFFTAKRVYNSSITNFDIDAGVNGISVDWGNTGQSTYSFRLLDGMVQSQSGIGIAIGGATGLVMDEIYYENCGREFVAIHSGTVVNYGGRITGQWVQPKSSPPPERVAAFDLGGCSSSGFKLGGNISQDQNLYKFNSASLGYFDTTNDRSAMRTAVLYDPVTRPDDARIIFNDGARWGLLWGNSGGMVLNPISRGIEYTHSVYDYVDPTDNVRIPIVQGVAATYPVGYGSGLDGLGASPAMLISAYTQKAWTKGSYLANPSPVEAGTAGSKYVITGWICTASGRPGTWLACRSLTGN